MKPKNKIAAYLVLAWVNLGAFFYISIELPIQWETIYACVTVVFVMLLLLFRAWCIYVDQP